MMPRLTEHALKPIRHESLPAMAFHQQWDQSATRLGRRQVINIEVGFARQGLKKSLASAVVANSRAGCQEALRTLEEVDQNRGRLFSPSVRKN